MSDSEVGMVAVGAGVLAVFYGFGFVPLIAIAASLCYTNYLINK